MSPLRLAYLHLVRNPVSTVIALVAIAAAVACGGMLLRLYELAGARFSTVVAGPDAVIGAKSSGIEILLGSLNAEGPLPATIPGALYRTLSGGRPVRMEDGTVYDLSAIRLSVPLLTIGLARGARVIATDGNFFRQTGSRSIPTLLAGTWFARPGEAVIGRGFSERNRVGTGDSIDVESSPDSGRGASPGRVRLAVVGVFAAGESAWNGCAFTGLSESQSKLHYVLLYLTDGASASIADLVNTRSVAEFVSVREEESRLARISGVGVGFGFSLTILVIALAGLAVLAVMTTRFEAMTTELALFQAMGFTFREIGAWLLLEGLLLAFPACLAGTLIENALLPSVCALMGPALPPAAVVTSPFYASATVWGVALLVTVAAVSVPWFRLVRQDAPASLRGV